jgi:hypothetical protein
MKSEVKPVIKPEIKIQEKPEIKIESKTVAQKTPEKLKPKDNPFADF